MRNKLFVPIILAVLALTACSDTTNNIGDTLTKDIDRVTFSTSSFALSSKSIVADAVLSRNNIGYLGTIKDPETNAYITGNYMTQFRIPENYAFPSKNKMANIENGTIVADSCEIRLFYQTYYGDSLAPMKLTAYLMHKPMNEDRNYYSNFDPIQQGYVTNNTLNVSTTYTLSNKNTNAEQQKKGYTKSIKIPLNKEYTDKNGKKYKNFATYILQQYYQHPQYFKNSFTFAQHVVPGFYIKSVSGLGSMAYIYLSQLNIYFTYKAKDKKNKETKQVGMASFSGTEEVLQTSNITNDKQTINNLVNDKTLTYLKTPAGIFTEITIPVEQILKGHKNDSINTAKLELKCINNTIKSHFALEKPQTLLLVQKDSMHTFFENKQIANFKTSYLATYQPTTNAYTFHNIAPIIKELAKKKTAAKKYSPHDWNKLVVIPVQTTYYTNNNTKTLIRVVHNMSPTSTKLIGGDNKLNLSVIYSHFQ